jgi:hypothetical protein
MAGERIPHCFFLRRDSARGYKEKSCEKEQRTGPLSLFPSMLFILLLSLSPENSPVKEAGKMTLK